MPREHRGSINCLYVITHTLNMDVTTHTLKVELMVFDYDMMSARSVWRVRGVYGVRELTS